MPLDQSVACVLSLGMAAIFFVLSLLAAEVSLIELCDPEY